MADQPYAPVVEALMAQTRAINALAREIREEFAQYQRAIQTNDTKRANAIAAAINKRTERIIGATEQLEASVPDAEVGGGPAEPPSTPDQGLPGDQPGIDNTLPGRDRPVDPGFGVDAERPSTGPVRPGRPTDPDFGVDAPERPVAPDQPPGGGDRPDQGPVRPSRPTDPDFGVDAPERPTAPDGPVRPGRPVAPDQPPEFNRPDQGLPPGDGGIDNELPKPPDGPNVPGGGPPVEPGQPLPPGGQEGTPPDRPNPADVPTLKYLAPSTAKVGESITFDVSGAGFVNPATGYIDGEAATETIFVNANMVRIKQTFGSAGAKAITVDGSLPLTMTVS